MITSSLLQLSQALSLPSSSRLPQSLCLTPQTLPKTQLFLRALGTRAALSPDIPVTLRCTVTITWKIVLKLCPKQIAKLQRNTAPGTQKERSKLMLVLMSEMSKMVGVKGVFSTEHKILIFGAGHC